MKSRGYDCVQYLQIINTIQVLIYRKHFNVISMPNNVNPVPWKVQFEYNFIFTCYYHCIILEFTSLEINFFQNCTVAYQLIQMSDTDQTGCLRVIIVSCVKLVEFDI